MNVQLCLFGLILLVGLEAAYEEEWAAHAVISQIILPLVK